MLFIQCEVMYYSFTFVDTETWVLEITLTTMEEDDQKPFLCALCYGAFTTLDALNIHQHSEHQINHLLEPSRYESEEQKSNEGVQTQDEEHLHPAGKDPTMKLTETDQKPHVCNMCYEIFMNLESLISHKEKEHFNRGTFVTAEKLSNCEESSMAVSTYSSPKPLQETLHNSDACQAYGLLGDDVHLKSEDSEKTDFIPSKYIKSEDLGMEKADFMSNSSTLSDLQIKSEDVEAPSLLSTSLTNNGIGGGHKKSQTPHANNDTKKRYICD